MTCDYCKSLIEPGDPFVTAANQNFHADCYAHMPKPEPTLWQKVRELFVRRR